MSLSSPELPASSNEPDPNFIRWLREHSVPIVFLVFLGLLLCVIGHYSPIDWGKTKDLTDAFSNVAQGVALIAAGMWAYFKFVKA